MTSNAGDVDTVLALEAPTKALLAAFEAARPAIERLTEADYPGAGPLSYKADMGGDQSSEGSPAAVLRCLEDLRSGGGEVGAYLYHSRCARFGETVKAAVDDLDEPDEKAALLHYAAALA